MTQQKPILIMAAGTGGHVFPALALAESLRARNIPVYWLGTPRGMENQIVPAAHIPLEHINIGGLRGKNALTLLLAPFKILLATWQAWRIMWRLKPAAVVGMGGFVAGPGGVAAWLQRRPLLIHEQNALPGMTNRWLAKIAHRVMQAFPTAFPVHHQPLTTGNPLRDTISAVDKPTTIHNPINILIIGGSLGAQALNETVPAALKQVTVPINVHHQTGKAHINAMRDAYHDATFNAEISAFIDDMAAAYTWADLVICRAGALTVSELAQVGVASILIPFPYAVDDHQTYNARFLADHGAALLIQQRDLSVAALAVTLNDLCQQNNKLLAMATAAKRCAQPQALQKVLAEVLHYAYGEPVKEDN